MVNKQKIIDIAIEQGILSSKETDLLKDDEFEENYEAELARLGVSDSNILDIKSRYFGIPGFKVITKDLDDSVVNIIPDKTISSNSVIPLLMEGNTLTIGFVDPDDSNARQAVDFIVTAKNLDFKSVVITQQDFDQLVGTVTTLSNEVGSALSELEAELVIDSSADSSTDQVTEEAAEAAPVTKIVATIIRYASEGLASDIHIEPYEVETIVRFRVDGALQQRLKLPAATHNAVVARIKILADMRIDEKRKPQDGRFSAHVDNHKIDFRVSTFPTSNGEKVVMRLLDSNKSATSIDDLELSERNLNLIKSAINEPFGLILISGPTGSGKSTTLYSMLKEVDRLTKNVLSLEDPVEYEIEGVSQSSINSDIGYTFASGLRTTLRQDPDIIMVGEIRDKETAELAIQAALTGHLVLSTIHTNSATGVIPRLVDMGIDPYLIAPTLKLAVGQRLVKKLCPGTGKQVPIEGAIKKIIDREFADLPPEFRTQITYPDYVLSAEPSPKCPKGTKGRMAVFEVLRMNHALEKILLEEPNEPKIYQAMRSDGMLTMREDAMIKSFKHQVPFEEVNKLGSGLFTD